MRKLFIFVCVLVVLPPWHANEKAADYLLSNPEKLAEIKAEQEESMDRMRRFWDSVPEEKKLKGSWSMISGSPSRITAGLPFSVRFLANVPFSALDKRDPMAQSLAKGNFLPLLEQFNIRVMSFRHELNLPSRATLFTELVYHDEVLELELPLVLRDESRYFLADAFVVQEELTNAVQTVTRGQEYPHPKPNLEFLSFEGFDELFLELSEEHFPNGIPVAYSYYLGDERFASQSQWFGRAPGLVSKYDPVIFLK